MASEVGIKVTQKGEDREEKQWSSDSLGRECVSLGVMTDSHLLYVGRVGN